MKSKISKKSKSKIIGEKGLDIVYKYRRSSLPIMSYLSEAQSLFIIKYGKPSKIIQQAREEVVKLMHKNKEDEFI